MIGYTIVSGYEEVVCMAYTLRDMLNTRAFQELQVIAGKDGLDNPVRYVGAGFG